MESTESTQTIAKKDREIRALQIKLADLESKVSQLEKNGARIRPVDLISMSFFAAINAAIIVVSIIFLISLKSNIL